jgi:putative ABC transport system permease protein
MKTFKNFLFVLNRFKTSSILNIFGLSVAFATFIIIMMQVDYDRNFDKYHENSDRIYRIEIVLEDGKWAMLSRPFADILFQNSAHIVAGALFFSIGNFAGDPVITVEQNGTTANYQEQQVAVSPSITKVFKFKMLEGLETTLEEPNTALIPQSLALKFFGNEPALGKQITSKQINSGNPLTIGGIYADFPANSSIENIIYTALDNRNLTQWSTMNYSVYVLLDEPGSEKEIIEHFKEWLPEAARNYQFKTTTIQFTKLTDLHYTTDIEYDFTPKSNRSTVTILWAIAIAILLIAGINFINFSLALVPRRIRSINTQKVLGASISAQRIMLTSEAVFINLFAYLLSLALVYFASQTPIAGLTDAGIDLLSHPLLIAITALVAVVTGIVAGVYPAFYSTSFQPAMVLKGSFALSAGGRKLRNLLISIQFVASLVLIISAEFIYLQNKHLYKIPVGYDKDQVIVTNVNDVLRENFDVFKTELKRFSGIEDISNCMFSLGARDQYMSWRFKEKDKELQFQVLPVDPFFLKVMNIQVTEGRDFREDDNGGVENKYIFNEKAQKEYDLTLNQKFVEGMGGEIIGFMPNIQFATLYQTITPMAFCVAQKELSEWYPALFAYIRVQAGSDMYAAIQHVKESVSAIDSEYPFDVRFYDDMMNKVYKKEQKLGFMITLFSLIAIIISIVGVFGLVTFETQYRRREISIRKVFGSTIEEVMRLFGKTYLIILGICFVIACPIAYIIVSRWLEKFAYKIPMYWWVFLLGGIIVLLVTVITVMTQSYKAATANPTIALNNE